MESEKYRVVIKETPLSKNVIHENITHSEMLKYYAEFRESEEFKVYVSENDSIWKLELGFEKGKAVASDIFTKQENTAPKATYGLPCSMSGLFMQFCTASPSRKENPVTLMHDIMQGIDVSKADLKLITNSNK